MDTSALSHGILRLYVPSAPKCNGHDQQDFNCNDCPTCASIPCRGLPSTIPGSSAGSARWEGSEEMPIPAVLKRLETNEHIHKVQVFFCSSYWLGANVLVPDHLKCMRSKPFHVQKPVPTTSSTPAVASELHLVPYRRKEWALPPMCTKVMALFFSTPCTGSHTNEWFSMTIRAMKRRRNGYVALSSTSCGAQKAAMLWQAMGTAAVSYATAWYLAGLVPLSFPWDKHTMDAMFQQGHDWLFWYGTFTA